MSKFKAIVDFSGYTGPDLAPVAQAIQEAMTTNNLQFPNPPLPMTDLHTQVTDYLDKLAAKTSRATAAFIAFNVARHTLEASLNDLGTYVNLVAQGDPTVIAASAFPMFDTAHAGPDTAPPPAPTDLKLRHGDLSGAVTARYHPGRVKSMNEVQISVGDPNVEASWSYFGMFSGGKATLNGLTPTSTLWVRVRTVGLKGVMGAWSDPAKIIVT